MAKVDAEDMKDKGVDESSETAKKPLKKTGKTSGKSNKLGGGGRFQQLVNQGKSPALAAYIGAKKYGSGMMSQMAAKSRKG